MFAFDLPFLFVCGIFLGILSKKQWITSKTSWLLGIAVLYIFQAGGMMLWHDIIPGSRAFMIIPFNILGLAANDFEPVVAPVLFALEPPLLVLGAVSGTKLTRTEKR